MGWLAVIGTALQIIAWCLNLWKESNDEKKKQKTEALQSVVRGLVDRDASRVTLGFSRMRSLK